MIPVFPVCSQIVKRECRPLDSRPVPHTLRVREGREMGTGIQIFTLFLFLLVFASRL